MEKRKSLRDEIADIKKKLDDVIQKIDDSQLVLTQAIAKNE
jgi:hypothetical protein